jgi:phosphatidylinositol alpha-1,6-mannosyltransferase
VAATGKPNILLSTQSLILGNGGICAVARMTASALLPRCRVEALACQDSENHSVGPISVQAFANDRLRFLLANLAAAQRATRVIYDFAGTARAHVDLPFQKRPYAVWMHGWEIWGESAPKYLRAISRAQLVLANSAYSVARASGMLSRGIEVVTCPLGTLEDAAPEKIGPSEGPPTVMLLGRADELFAKGHDLLIEVWPDVLAAVPDAKLLLVGGGNAIDKVRGLAALSPARHAIEIRGFVPDGALEACWRRTTVFAMLGFAEGFGLVYAEAMRRGLPVIASTEDAGQEINLEGKTGLNVSRKNKKRLTEALVLLLNDRDYARSLGAAGHALWKEKYSFSAFSERLVAAIGRFLAV